MMQFYSTNSKALNVNFEEAVRSGLAPDGGLFMPEEIKKLPREFWNDFHDKSFVDTSFQIAAHFLQGSLPEAALKKIIEHTLQFEAPLISIEENIFSLELFHGPTLAFKDFGARFLSGVMGYLAKQRSSEMTILVATSGDTGSAVANGFLNVPGTRVVVLYPSGKVSEIQEKQFTTLGGNIIALAVEGTFDDCQRLVKQAFGDEEIKRRRILTSANSINIARLLPQMFYYFRAFQQLPAHLSTPVVVSVPSGNFGNLTAGLMAKKMGLPIEKFVAATNVNDVVPAYLQTNKFTPRASVSTVSNAMDVGDPSNFARMLALYDHSHASLIRELVGYKFTDEETLAVMKEVYKRFNYILDPHGAVGYLGLKKYLSMEKSKAIGIFLETADPAKFKEVVESAIQEIIPLPERLLSFVQGKKNSIPMKNDFGVFKKILLDGL